MFAVCSARPTANVHSRNRHWRACRGFPEAGGAPWGRRGTMRLGLSMTYSTRHRPLLDSFRGGNELMKIAEYYNYF
ncbi:MAG: hypothetical protein KJ007_10660, partial [Burkholderiales bacterium]|nr:hypothetical protein [Burkholderiales bacterium]